MDTIFQFISDYTNDYQHLNTHPYILNILGEGLSTKKNKSFIVFISETVKTLHVFLLA